MNEFLAGQTAKPLSDPGAEWRYSNFGYCLLANVIEAAAGQEFASYVEKSIFRPAGMKDAVFESPAVNAAGEIIGWQTVRHLATPYHGSPDSLTVRGGISYVMKGAGGVICTVDDMARYGEAVLSGRLLPVEKAKVMWTDTAPTGGSPYGYGWVVRSINGQTVPSHSGGNNGYISELSIVPEKGIVVAVASNRAYASARAMSDAALEALLP